MALDNNGMSVEPSGSKRALHTYHFMILMMRELDQDESDGLVDQCGTRTSAGDINESKTEPGVKPGSSRDAWTTSRSTLSSFETRTLMSRCKSHLGFRRRPNRIIALHWRTEPTEDRASSIAPFDPCLRRCLLGEKEEPPPGIGAFFCRFYYTLNTSYRDRANVRITVRRRTVCGLLCFSFSQRRVIQRALNLRARISPPVAYCPCRDHLSRKSHQISVSSGRIEDKRLLETDFRISN